MAGRSESRKERAIRQCDETIQWYQAIIDNPGVMQSAKEAAQDLLKQAERQKRDILSGKTTFAGES